MIGGECEVPPGLRLRPQLGDLGFQLLEAVTAQLSPHWRILRVSEGQERRGALDRVPGAERD